MKNLKKVLALVLAFACAFTMFAGAVVYPDVPAGSEYSEAITMLSDLGIIQGKDDGKYHSEDTITRAEACALIARMLTGDPQVSQYAGASNFTDVVKGSWKESVVGYCVVNGITVGVGNNKFEPDRAITDAEFVTMVVRAMGYETTGTSYPYGHISAAQANGLLDDVTVVPSSAALRGEDAQIIYNALFADYARGAKQVNTTHGTTVEEYPTIAEDVFGLKRAAVGTYDEKNDVLKKCQAHTWVIAASFKKADGTSKLLALAIEDDETTLHEVTKKQYGAFFDYDGDASALVGYQVELWGEGEHGKDEYDTIDLGGEKIKALAMDWDIKAIKTVKGQTTYAYNPTMADSKTDGTLKFDGNELDLDSKNLTEDSYATVYMGKNPTDEKIEKVLNLKNSAQYTLFDWDSDGQIDWIDLDYTYYGKVESITSKKLKLTDFDGCIDTLDLDNGAIDYEVVKNFTVKGDLPSDLEKDDIVAIDGEAVWNNKLTEVTITLTVKVVEPETKELTDVDSKDKAWFDGEKIEVADDVTYGGTKYYYYFKNNSINGSADTADWYNDLDEDDEDTSYDLYRDANGYIIFAEEAESTSKGYIFVTGLEEGENKTGSRNLMVVSGRLDDNSKLEDAKVNKDATIELASDVGTTLTKGTNLFKDNALKKGVDASDIIGRAFKYSVNDDDQITKLIEVAMPQVSTSDAYTFTDKNDLLSATTQDGTKDVWLDDCKVIFAVRKFKKPDNTNTYFRDINDISMVDDIDLDDVMAVQVEDLPDIGAGKKTTAWGVHFSEPTNKARVETVVLGVNTFRYFANSTTTAGLVTYVKYNSKTEKYTVTASIPGKDDTSFTTVKKGDLNAATITTIQNHLTGANSKYGIFCEFEFNTDGEITEVVPMTVGVTANANLAHSEDGINVDAKQCSYTVARVIVDHVANKSSDDTLTVMLGKSDDGKTLNSVNTGAGLAATLDLKDSTKYYVIGEDVVLPKNGVYMDAWTEGFSTKFELDDIEDAKKSDLVSFVENDTETDEYVVADIIIDDGDVVAVYYYEEPVAESTALAGSVKVNTNYPLPATVVYDEAHYTVSVACNDAAKKAGSEFIKVYTTKVENGNTVKDTLVDKYNGASQDLKGIVNAGTYYVEGWAVNKYTYEDCLVDAGFLTVDKATMHLTLAIDGKTYTDAKLTGAVEGLSYNNFVVSVNDVVVEEAFDYDLRYDVTEGVYHFEFDRYLSDGDVVTVAVKDVANYNDTETLATVDPAPTTVEVLSVAGKNLITVKAANVPAGATWTVSFDGREYSATAAPNGDKYVLTVGDPVIATNPDCDFTQSHDAYTVEVSVNGASGTLVVTPA